MYMYTVCKIIKNFIYKTKNIGLSSLGSVQWPDQKIVGTLRIHSANHIIVVYSNRFVLVFIVSYLRNISQFSPSHSLCFTHLVVVHDVRDLLIQALYSRRLEVSKSTCYTHLLVAGNYRHIPIHWKKNSILLGGNKEFWRRRVSEVV